MNINLTIEKYNKIYEIFDLLRKAAYISDIEVSSLFEPDGDNSNKSIFRRMCSSLQNSGHMGNSIKFNDENYELIREKTNDFNAAEFCRKYDRWENFYRDLTDNGKLDNGKKEKKIKAKVKRDIETNWEKYAKGLFEGANFLIDGGFEKIKKLTLMSKQITKVSDENINSIMEISQKIHGLGFALTCDWLKECGCLWLVKPDVHMKEVYRHLTHSSKKSISDSVVIKDMFDYSLLIKRFDAEMTAYKLDKIIWLICTGNFYKYDIKIGRELIIKKI